MVDITIAHNNKKEGTQVPTKQHSNKPSNKSGNLSSQPHNKPNKQQEGISAKIPKQQPNKDLLR